MAGKREKPEEIVSNLRRVEILQGQVMTVAEAVRQIGVTQQTFYRWRKLYGGMGRSQLARLKELEKENQRLRRAAPGGLGHVGLQGRFVYKDKSFQMVVHERLATGDPNLALLRNVRPLLFAGPKVFFCVLGRAGARIPTWRTAARRGLLHCNPNRPAGAGSSLNHTGNCPSVGE